MINRGNWRLTNKYLNYRFEVHQLSTSSVNLEERWLKHVLQWAEQTPFSKAPGIRPVLPTYLITARQDQSGIALSQAYTEKIIGCARRFFSWLNQHEVGFRKLNAAWLDTLRPPRHEGKSNKFVAVTLKEMLEIAAAPVENLEERRIRAAACFWFLSGIRIGAFVTLPISAVNLTNMSVNQWPELGVKTKYKKKAKTFLLDIPELFNIVVDWDNEIRALLSEDNYWFSKISSKNSQLDTSTLETGNHRDSRARKSLKSWLKNVGIKYHNPHSFRHGHAVYSIKQAINITDLKSISMNLMHESIQVTDKVYGVFSEQDVRNTIVNLGKFSNSKELASPEIIVSLKKILRKLETDSRINR